MLQFSCFRARGQGRFHARRQGCYFARGQGILVRGGTVLYIIEQALYKNTIDTFLFLLVLVV